MRWRGAERRAKDQEAGWGRAHTLSSAAPPKKCAGAQERPPIPALPRAPRPRELPSPGARPSLRAPSLRCLREKSSRGLFLPAPPLSCCQLRWAIRNFTWTPVPPCAARSRLSQSFRSSPFRILVLSDLLTTCSFLGIEVSGWSQIAPSTQARRAIIPVPDIPSLLSIFRKSCIVL